MAQSTHPSKEAVRAWLQQQVQRKRPPPDVKQVQRALNWKTVTDLTPPRKERS